MNLIKDRDARTKKRQKAKEKFDKNITLSLANNDKKYKFAANANGDAVRLLDEGAIVTANGDLDLYIEKGTIEKFVNGENQFVHNGNGKVLNLTKNYEGTINIGHQDFATFPFIVGTWTKEDLTVVETEDGRHGLDVNLNLNSAHPLVQALRVQGIPVGVSVEMYLNFDEEASEKEGVPIVNEIFIADFGIVGECGNVGSSGSVDLQGVKMEKTVKDIMEDVEEVEVEEAPASEPDVEDTEETEEVAEEAVEETEEEVTEEAEEQVEETEEDESVEEEASEEVSESDEEAEDEEDALSVAEETIEALKAENESLKAQIEALKKSNNKKDKKIKENAEKNAEFAKKFKGLSVSMGLTKEVKEVPREMYNSGNGIGE